jgi:hypothetical protein
MKTLGTGVLTWNRDERISDRYGTVYLIDEGHNSNMLEPSPSIIKSVDGLVGKRGALLARIIESRKSTHIGDLFRGVGPRKRAVGVVLKLGSGELFAEPAIDGGLCVGLKPGDGRETDWLDIRALYDAHEQTVELAFDET